MSRLLIRMCAMWYHPSGSIQALSRGLGLGPRTLGSYMTQERLLTAELAIRLEQTLGRHVITRELLRPDLFVVQEKERPAGVPPA